MTNDKPAPRSWWAIINKTRNDGTIAAKDRRVQYEENVEHIHVIEYSAYEACVKACNEYDKQNEQLRSQLFSKHLENNKLYQEIERLADQSFKDATARTDLVFQCADLKEENARLREALEFECGNRCHPEHNPCNARAALEGES